MIHTIPLRDLFPGRSLYADCWEGRKAFRSLVPRYFRDPGAFAAQHALLSGRRYDRGTLLEVLTSQNAAFGCGPRAMEAIGRLADPASTVVIGGQQAGLFGGPLYTVHKALTILALAARLEKELGAPVVPVFWIASEDSDLAEVDRALVTDRDGRLRTVRLAGDEGAKLPVSLVRLGPDIRSALEELAGALPESASALEVLDGLRAAYAPGRTYPQAFGAWMAWLFRDRGLVLVDPSDARLKRIALPLFTREVAEKSPVSAAVIEQTGRLAAEGYPAQVELRPGLLTLFYQNPSRDAVAVRDDGYELRTSGRRFSAGELAGLLGASPESFGPNAVLRPLFQDTLFPTVSVVLGPAELAYFTQLTLAYERMGIPMPVLFPRASLTLVEPRMERLLAKYGISLGEILARGGRVIDDIVKREIPGALLERLADGRRTAGAAWQGIVAHIDRLDPTLKRTAELAAGRSARQFEFVEKKITKAARRKNEILRGQVERLVASLAPGGGLQERSLSALPFLASFGRGVLDDAARAIDLFAPEHRGVVIEP